MNSGIERQAAHFDGIAETYLKSRQHRNHLTFKDLMWREFLDRKPYLKLEGQRVLEPMCGYGDGRKILSAHLGTAFDYRGFDYSGAVIDRLRELEPDIAVSHQDVTRFEAHEDYDLIILLGGLHHVPSHAARVVGKLASALKPGGYFISLEPTDGNPVLAGVRRWIYRRNKLFDEETERSFPMAEYRAMFDSAGLHLVDDFYPGLLAYVLYYNPDAFPLLNIGGPGLVRALWTLERPFRRGAFGRVFSFATLSLWRKPGTA